MGFIKQFGELSLAEQIRPYDEPQPYPRLAKLLQDDRQFVDKVCWALCRPCLVVVWRRRSAASNELPGNVTPKSAVWQCIDHLAHPRGEVH
jgi:hypothetical protein